MILIGDTIELNSIITPTQLKEYGNLFTNIIVDNLKELNTEYRKLHNSIDTKAVPEIVLFNKGDDQFTINKNKHKWISH